MHARKRAAPTARAAGGNRLAAGDVPGEVSLQGFWMKAILSFLGIAFVIAWLVLWLAVKVTFGAIHLLVVIGVILIVLAFVDLV